jgi:hypothetical protein
MGVHTERRRPTHRPSWSRQGVRRSVLTANRNARNLQSAVLDRQVLTPLTSSAFCPVPGYARYRMPLGGLYLCGAAWARTAWSRSRLAGGHKALLS